MGCKCESIVRCKNDIGVVTAARDTLKAHEKMAEEYIDVLCSQIAKLAEDALLPPSHEMSLRIKALNNSIATSLPWLIKDCNIHLNRLNDGLNTLQSEDWSFHNS